MPRITRSQKIGIVVLVLSFLIGSIGAAFSVYSSFAALDAAELGGIGPVGDQIKNALSFSLGGVGGCVVGAVLIVFGRPKAKAEPHKESDR